MESLGTNKKKSLLAAVLISMLSACGGGGSSNAVMLQPDTSAGESKTPPVSSITPSTGTVAAKTNITTVIFQSESSSSQTDVPVTFGHVFKEGEIYPAKQSLSGTLENGTAVPFQTDIKATHADGSIRHAVISTVIPQLGPGQQRTLTLTRIEGISEATEQGISAEGSGPAIVTKANLKPADLVASGFQADVTLQLNGQTYQASADSLLKNTTPENWLAGPVANEWLLAAPFRNEAGVEHPHLTARFAIRPYGAVDKARVDVIVENNWAYEPGPQNFTYDVEVKVGGKSVYSKADLTHFHHARWRKTFWWGTEPQVHVSHDKDYLIASKAVLNYDLNLNIPEAALSSLQNNWNKSNNGPMGPGIVLPAMGTTGGRPDIAPLPQWTVLYLLSMDSRAKAVTLGTGELAGSWPIHYRDKRTGLPISLDEYPYMTLLGTNNDTTNPQTGIKEAFPACGGDCSTSPINYSPDSAHQPSFAYIPYMITGDYFFLEELQFWANYNLLRNNPRYRGFAKGLVKSDQVRGQAWSLRTLAHAAYITPTQHPLKIYFDERLNNNINWYHETYVVGNPNLLGMLDGTDGYTTITYDTPAGKDTGIAPWQDDFFTSMIGHLVELGFEQATPLFQWKARFPVSRMIDPEYCWVDGAIYSLTVRQTVDSPLYSSLGEAYRASMKAPDNTTLVNSTGKPYLQESCGSQEQADWRTIFDRDYGTKRAAWSAGEMTGYASEPAGFPSNMQPALALAATLKSSGANSAWKVFDQRSIKPNYSNAPQWAIVPR